MVVFACNNCGESLQKPRVAKHYQFQCKKRISLSCVDCFKDFLDNEYTAHTKCITEAERYGGKNFIAKASANKGERKQQEWIKIINNVLTGSSKNLSKEEINFLQSILKHENVPRKKGKFLNFVNNAMGYRVNNNVIESCWSKIETAFKQNVNNGNNDNNEQQQQVINDNNKRILENNEQEEKLNIVTAKKCKLEINHKVDDDNDVVVKDKLVWSDKIIEILGERDEMSLKKLKKKLINKYLSCYYQDNGDEKFDKKLMKKLGKLKELKVENGKIKRL